GNALSLAARQFGTTISDDHGEPTGQFIDKFTACRISRLKDLLISRVRASVANVLHYRSLKKRNILWYERDCRTEAVLGDARYLLPVNQNLAVLRVIETLQQCKES